MDIKSDLAGKDHWNTVWNGSGHGPYKDVFSAGLFYRIRKFPFIHIMDTIASHLKDRLLPGATLLEIGCGGSQWLPAFAKRFDVYVSGIDYSEQGCASARAILEKAGVMGGIVQADLFDPPAGMKEGYDLVVSFGVLEHFQDTEGCLAAMAGYLKPSGRLVTVIPNMTGMVGWFQKLMDPAVYAMHVPLTKKDLMAAHTACGLQTIFCNYCLPFHLGVVNMSRLKRHPATRGLWYLIGGVNFIVQAMNMTLSRGLHLNLCSRFTSPYLMCIARKGMPVHV